VIAVNPGMARGLARPIMWFEQLTERKRTGYSLTELAVVLGILGSLTALATPSFLTYYQASRLRVGAEEVAAFINQGRQLGIRQNVGVCVHITSAALQYRLGSSCSGTAWVGPGTDSSGNIRIPQDLSLTTTADPIFNYLGAAAPAATITVRNTKTKQALSVVVSVSGRVRITGS
jgi:prepilin-type N-terminal cleavage/methylation domain-containing protein